MAGRGNQHGEGTGMPRISEDEDLKELLIEIFHDSHMFDDGLSTGYSGLDQSIGGLMKGSLILLAARPATGKIRLAINIAKHVVKNEGVPVAFFSFEQSREMILENIICSESKIELKKLKTYDLTDDETILLMKKRKQISNMDLYIDDYYDYTISRFCSVCRKMKEQLKIGLVIVDYLQLFDFLGPTGTKTNISEIACELNKLAKELEIPIFVISQLTKRVDNRLNHRAELEDFRFMGLSTQFFDVILSIHSDDYYNSEPAILKNGEIVIIKNRYGPLDKVEVVWDYYRGWI